MGNHIRIIFWPPTHQNPNCAMCHRNTETHGMNPKWDSYWLLMLHSLKLRSALLIRVGKTTKKSASRLELKLSLS